MADVTDHFLCCKLKMIFLHRPDSTITSSKIILSSLHIYYDTQTPHHLDVNHFGALTLVILVILNRHLCGFTPHFCLNNEGSHCKWSQFCLLCQFLSGNQQQPRPQYGIMKNYADVGQVWKTQFMANESIHH